MAAYTQIVCPGEFPIKLVKWKVKKDSMVTKGAVLALYEVENTESQAKLKSTASGIVDKIFVDAGMAAEPGNALVTLRHQESGGCTHPTVMKDMCADCGADLRREPGIAGDWKETMSASVAMVHNIPELIVSQEQALELGREDETRLLKTRKLVLLVDLDQTLIHTTNDNIPANLKDVFHFQMCQGPHQTWYHTKFRPYTRKFLEHISQMFELHICTFGVRLYAHTVARLIDPDEKFFSHRILSRDECFDPQSKTANLKALFPCGDGMVCIIDDREDVWNNAPNLVHVKPYRFFQGTADINAPPGLDKTENDSIPITHKVIDHHEDHSSDGKDKTVEKSDGVDGNSAEKTVSGIDEAEMQSSSGSDGKGSQDTKTGDQKCSGKKEAAADQGSKDEQDVSQTAGKQTTEDTEAGKQKHSEGGTAAAVEQGSKDGKLVEQDLSQTEGKQTTEDTESGELKRSGSEEAAMDQGSKDGASVEQNLSQTAGKQTTEDTESGEQKRSGSEEAAVDQGSKDGKLVEQDLSQTEGKQTTESGEQKRSGSEEAAMDQGSKDGKLVEQDLSQTEGKQTTESGEQKRSGSEEAAMDQGSKDGKLVEQDLSQTEGKQTTEDTEAGKQKHSMSGTVAAEQGSKDGEANTQEMSKAAGKQTTEDSEAGIQDPTPTEAAVKQCITESQPGEQTKTEQQMPSSAEGDDCKTKTVTDVSREPDSDKTVEENDKMKAEQLAQDLSLSSDSDSDGWDEGSSAPMDTEDTDGGRTTESKELTQKGKTEGVGEEEKKTASVTEKNCPGGENAKEGNARGEEAANLEVADPRKTKDTVQQEEAKESGEDELEWVDDDDYLLHLEEILTRIHKAYYSMFDEGKQLSSAEVAPTSKRSLPDLKSLIPYIKRKTLKGCNIVFSGVVPLNTPPERSRGYNVARMLGAAIQANIVAPKQASKKHPATTHLVAAKPGTGKHKTALRTRGVNIVSVNWLWACAERWERCDERLFSLGPLPGSEDSSPVPTRKGHPKQGKRKRKSGAGDGESDEGAANGEALSAEKRQKTTEEQGAERENDSWENTEQQSDGEMSHSSERSGASFADTVNPLMAFSDEDLECMDKEVDDLMAEEGSDSDDEDEEDRIKRIRTSVLGSQSDTDSSSDSLAGELPRGWKLRRKSKPSPDSNEDDLDKQKKKEIEAETEDTENEMSRFSKTVDAFAPDSESNTSFADSIGSVDDEIAEAVEKEFLASL
ncbi:RNA polymerase II subunit A C-terminal domain phosphatase-like [Littorina saxatilis]|uniref:RNA polymerase II subunit A C-terminal domain phosphatase n=1 Tax=Littorina saxatilis TaxID=31220 RepID=A0AAN9GMY8_9CAEN